MAAGDNHPDTGAIEPLPRDGTMSEALTRVRALCTREDIGPALKSRLAVVVEELVLNLIEHGGAPVMAMALERTADGIRVILTDDGAPFDPRGARQGDIPPERGGGAGIALVLAWSEIISYRTQDGRNRLELLVRDRD